MTPPEDLPKSIRRNPSELALLGGFGWAVKILGSLLILLILGLLFGRKVWTTSKRNTALGQAREARLAMEQKQWEAAATLIRDAREALPNDPEVLRLMVDYLDKTGLDQVLEIQTLRTLESQGLQQPGDALLAGRAHVRKGDLVSARAVWQKLSREQQMTAEALSLKAQILGQEGGGQASGKLQRLATQRSADDPESGLKLAVHDLESGYPAVMASGLTRLWKISEGEDEVGMQALRHLLSRTDLTLDEGTQLQQRVKKNPGAMLIDDLGALSIIMRLDPARRSQLLDEVLTQHQDAGIEATVILARWLAQEKEVDRLTKHVPPQLMIKSQELFPVYLQALAESGRWQQISELLKKQQGLPMTMEGLAVWRALAASRLQPDLKQAAYELKVAIKQAGSTHNFGPLRAASQLAEDLELWDIAMEGYQQLSQSESPQELDMLEKCWLVASHLGNSDHLLITARKQSALRPTSRHFANRLDYLRLLRGEEIECAVSPHDASRGDEQDENAQTALLEALKEYRLGDAAQAKAALMQVKDAASLPAGQRAVYAGLLASVGDPARAYQLAEKISSRLLIAEEQVFLRKAL